MLVKKGSGAAMRLESVEKFRVLHTHARRLQMVRRLLARPDQLYNLHAQIDERNVKGGHAGGLRTVPIAAIKGSEGRAADFDTQFRPLRWHSAERWISIAIARMADVALPPVELVQVGKVYYVRDGHHRISVAKHFGQIDIDAQVIVWDVAENRGYAAPAPATVPTLRMRAISYARHLVCTALTGLRTIGGFQPVHGEISPVCGQQISQQPSA